MSPGRINNWRVAVSSRVKRQIGRLPADERLRVLQTLDKLTDGPWQMHASKLHGRPEWRLRIGNRRVLFLPDSEDHSLTVVDLGSRGDVYKDN